MQGPWFDFPRVFVYSPVLAAHHLNRLSPAPFAMPLIGRPKAELSQKVQESSATPCQPWLVPFGVPLLLLLWVVRESPAPH